MRLVRIAILTTLAMALAGCWVVIEGEDFPHPPEPPSVTLSPDVGDGQPTSLVVVSSIRLEPWHDAFSLDPCEATMTVDPGDLATQLEPVEPCGPQVLEPDSTTNWTWRIPAADTFQQRVSQPAHREVWLDGSHDLEFCAAACPDDETVQDPVLWATNVFAVDEIPNDAPTAQTPGQLAWSFSAWQDASDWYGAIQNRGRVSMNLTASCGPQPVAPVDADGRFLDATTCLGPPGVQPGPEPGRAWIYYEAPWEQMAGVVFSIYPPQGGGWAWDSYYVMLEGAHAGRTWDTTDWRSYGWPETSTQKDIRLADDENLRIRVFTVHDHLHPGVQFNVTPEGTTLTSNEGQSFRHEEPCGGNWTQVDCSDPRWNWLDPGEQIRHTGDAYHDGFTFAWVAPGPDHDGYVLSWTPPE